MSINTYLTKLADFYSKVRYDDIRPDVIAKTRRVFADFLCCLAAGAKVGEFSRIWNSYVIELGGSGEATLLCVGRKIPAFNAAASMAIMGHSTELDDGHRWGTCHPAVSVIPAIMAVGEREKSSFKDMLTAIIIGYDVMLRSAKAINPSHLERGFHSTGTCGSLGAAAGCAHLLQMGNTKIGYAIAIGGLQSAGLQEMLHDYPGIKPLQPGKAAIAGVLAADLVWRGAKGPRTLYEGEHGWLKAMCVGKYSEEALIGELGKRWELMNTYTKLYPTCRHCHAAIDLAREAKRNLRCNIEEIQRIEIKTYSLGFSEVGRIICPTSVEEAMFSMPFSVAMALDRGNVGLNDFSAEVLSDERLQKLAGKISISIDEKMDARYPEERGAWIHIYLSDGRVFEKGIPLAKGEPEYPVSDSDYLIKFESMLTAHYPREFIDGLWEILVRRDVNSVSYNDVIEQFRRFSHEDKEYL